MTFEMEYEVFMRKAFGLASKNGDMIERRGDPAGMADTGKLLGNLAT